MRRSELLLFYLRNVAFTPKWNALAIFINEYLRDLVSSPSGRGTGFHWSTASSWTLCRLAAWFSGSLSGRRVQNMERDLNGLLTHWWSRSRWWMEIEAGWFFRPQRLTDPVSSAAPVPLSITRLVFPLKPTTLSHYKQLPGLSEPCNLVLPDSVQLVFVSSQVKSSSTLLTTLHICLADWLYLK